METATTTIEENKQKLGLLIKNRPSAYKWIVWNKVRLWFFLIWGFSSLIYSAYIFITSFIDNAAQGIAKDIIKDYPEIKEPVIMSHLEQLFPIHITVGVEALLISMCCFIIAGLFKKLMKRNKYISELETTCKGIA